MSLTEDEVEHHGLLFRAVTNKVLEDAYEPRLERGQSVRKSENHEDFLNLTALCP